jgi:hypothetical protein
MPTKLFISRFVVGLSNPVDAMYYVQPWMLAVIVPLACIREGMSFCFFVLQLFFFFFFLS